MKTIKTFLTAILLATTTAASAQFVNSDVDNYSLLTASAGMMSSNFTNGAEGKNAFGGSIGYLWGFNVTGHKLPLFVEVGPEVNYYTSSNEELILGKTTAHNLSVTTPVNLVYKLRVSDKVSIAPFVGLSSRWNAMAKIAADGKSYDSVSDGNASRFQLGLNTGVGVYFDNFYLGYRYNHDLTSFQKATDKLPGISFDYHSISLGFKF